MTQVLKGACLCGACTLTATPTAAEATICHCGQCNRWSGGMFISVYCGNSVEIAADSPIGSYKGSAWGERVFCQRCGAALMWQTQDGAHQSVTIHAFDDPQQFTLTRQIFTDRKPDCYTLANHTETMTEAEAIAAFGGGAG